MLGYIKMIISDKVLADTPSMLKQLKVVCTLIRHEHYSI